MHAVEQRRRRGRDRGVGAIAIAGLGGLVVLATIAPAADASAMAAPGERRSDAGDGPKRQPSPAWRATASCGSDADADAGADVAATHCTMTFAGEIFVVSSESGGGGTTVLSVFETATGEQRWAEEIDSPGPVTVSDDVVLVAGAATIDAYDSATGRHVWSRNGTMSFVNLYGVVGVAAPGQPGAPVTAVALETGEELWSTEGAVVASCSDFIVQFSSVGEMPATFDVLDQRTGEVRWTSDTTLERHGTDLTCGGAWVYTSDGSIVTEYDAYDGWVDWETPVEAGASKVELYREAALVRSGDGTTITAISRLDGTELWARSTSEAGRVVSARALLRVGSDGSLFTMHPLSGAVAARTTPPPPGTDQDVIGVSDTRVVVDIGSTITTYGLNDLGVAWSLDLDQEPDDVGVSDSFLIVRDGSTLVGYS